MPLHCLAEQLAPLGVSHHRHQNRRCQKRISGPLLDRIDIHLDVPRIPHEQLTERRSGESSATICERVERARERQIRRFAEG